MSVLATIVFVEKKRKHCVHQCSNTAICWTLLYVHLIYLLEELLEQSMTMEATDRREIFRQEKSWQVAILVLAFLGSCSLLLLHGISDVSLPCSRPQPYCHALVWGNKSSEMALIFWRSDWKSPWSHLPDSTTEHFNNLQGFKMSFWILLQMI